ncbi:MAG TPA: tRNA (guanosine(37)-N1)-methyltransferase TrmD, partial [Phycisphaerae bacterium]|nr:tRNA (guanosine(37)-N1)-methyltransferase TrmD [Phycisphaerae bacterium]
MSVPEIVLSGDHARIERWRKIQALRRTRERRPDLFEKIIKAQPELSRLVDEGAD